jgi:hypothetical protein
MWVQITAYGVSPERTPSSSDKKTAPEMVSGAVEFVAFSILLESRLGHSHGMGASGLLRRCVVTRGAAGIVVGRVDDGMRHVCESVLAGATSGDGVVTKRLRLIAKNALAGHRHVIAGDRVVETRT